MEIEVDGNEVGAGPLTKLGDEFAEWSGVQVPGAFEWVVEIGDDKVGEKQKHGCDGDRDETKQGVSESAKEEKKKHLSRSRSTAAENNEIL